MPKGKKNDEIVATKFIDSWTPERQPTATLKLVPITIYTLGPIFVTKIYIQTKFIDGFLARVIREGVINIPGG